jgi:hypothetical protein
MTAMTPQQGQDYLERWKLVRERESLERRAASFEERGRQLSVLMDSGSLFGRDPHRERLVEVVRLRWMRIHKAFSD